MRPGDVLRGSGPTFTMTMPDEPATVGVSVNVGDGESEWTAERLPDDPEERAMWIAERMRRCDLTW